MTDIRKEVRKQYGEIGAAGRIASSCCSPSETGVAPSATDIGYSQAEKSSLPEGADLGLGCGNPQAIASLKPGEVVVDLGSGGGIDCFLAAKQVGENGRVIGVDMTPEMIDRPVTWVVCDASFIGLSKVLERPLELAQQDCRLVALIKPQFEVGREEVGKKGVVSDPALHRRVCDEVCAWVEGLGFEVQGIVESPITGPEGNVEFLISAQRSAPRD